MTTENWADDDGDQPDNWDPEPHQRTYYRHARTGDLAYLVRRDGSDVLRYDRPNEEILRKLTGEWNREPDRVPYSRHQVAAVAFAADRALCAMMGMHKESRDQWSSLHEKERLEYLKRGPRAGGVRDRLWAAIFDLLGPEAR
jgi:hypothetical protein